MSLDLLLKSINVEKITEDGGFEDLPDGYYLCEVDSVELTTSKKGDDMMKWQFTVAENGIGHDEDGNNIEISSTKGRKVFNYQVIKDEAGLKRVISDLLKFEKAEDEALLDKEYFSTTESLELCLGLLEGKRIFIHLSSSENKETKEISQWKRYVTWNGARSLGLTK